MMKKIIIYIIVQLMIIVALFIFLFTYIFEYQDDNARFADDKVSSFLHLIRTSLSDTDVYFDRSYKKIAQEFLITDSVFRSDRMVIYFKPKSSELIDTNLFFLVAIDSSRRITCCEGIIP